MWWLDSICQPTCKMPLLSRTEVCVCALCCTLVFKPSDTWGQGAETVAVPFGGSCGDFLRPFFTLVLEVSIHQVKTLCSVSGAEAPPSPSSVLSFPVQTEKFFYTHLFAACLSTAASEEPWTVTVHKNKECSEERISSWSLSGFTAVSFLFPFELQLLAQWSVIYNFSFHLEAKPF